MRIDQGFPVFYGKDGTRLKSGWVYIGEVNEDAETHLVDVFWDDAFTQSATNPLSVRNGLIMQRGRPVPVFTENEYSITVRDGNGILQFTSPNGCMTPSSDVLSTLSPVLDARYVKKAGDTMTGPLAIADAVGPNDLYSRNQLDALLALRSSATFVIDSTTKWNAFITNAPGNDYTDTLIKRGTYHVSAGAVPATCKRLRGEVGSELFFDATDAANFGISVADGQVTEICDFVVTIQTSSSNTTNNRVKIAISARDAYIHDMIIVGSFQGNTSGLSLTAVTGSNVRDVTVSAFSEAQDYVLSVTIFAVAVLAPNTSSEALVRNISISVQPAILASLGRIGALLSNGLVTLVAVHVTTDLTVNMSWYAPTYNTFSLITNASIKLTLLNLIGTLNRNSVLSIRAALTFRFTILDLRIVEWNGGSSVLNIVYAANLLIDAQSSTFKQSSAVPTIGTALMSVKGALGIESINAATVCQDVIFGAYVVEMVLTMRNTDLGANYAVRTCRHVRNCSVTIPAGSKYAADVYTSSDTSVPVAATAAGGWNT